MQKSSLIKGIFVEEVKNRFLCKVNIDGDCVLCYIPSSCRLSNFMNMDGRKVLLEPVASHTARTKYSLFAVKIGRRYIPVNLSKTNAVVMGQLHRRCFDFFGKRKEAFREKTIEGYKCDLFLPESNAIVEIKSILQFDKQALFPSINSERMLRQLTTISALLDKGYKVYYLIISLNPDVDTIVLDGSRALFSEAFKACVYKGMDVYGFDVIVKSSEIRINKRLPVVID